MLSRTIGRLFGRARRPPRMLPRLVFRQFATPRTEAPDPADSTVESTESVVDEPVVDRSSASSHQFQAETKRLLEIVAKSLYTDKDVFLRELLSNCSDAIEKQRILTLTGKSNALDPLQINVITNEAKRQIIFQDTGIGMTKQDLVDHLGTIAGSGSRKFVERLQKEGSNPNLDEKIIGQFGVGFYSAFIVADTVEVFSRAEGETRAHGWVSDGSGSFQVFEADNFHLAHGTRVVLHLKPEFAQFARADEVRKVIEKYSNFITHPIFLNQDRINVVSALWARGKKDVSEPEYATFFEYLSKSKTPYKYKLHLNLEVPLTIKALLYVPSHNSEMFGFGQTEMNVSLFSRRVLIKPNCRELLPSYLRFVKGVVDCEDLPLNISRENYQDSALIAKLRNILTKRVLKMLEEESRRSPDDYNKWHKDFHIFLKEGIHTDQENAETLLALSRFDSTFAETISLDDYIAKLEPGQKNIYYFLAPSRDVARHSPYMEPFLKNEVPVLYISINVEEMLFRQMQNYKNFKFVNVESPEAEIPRELLKQETTAISRERLPEEDLTPFFAWVRAELQPIVSTVNVSRRLTDSPAVVVSPMTSGMRQMMAFIDQSQFMESTKNLTLEVNATHPIIVKLNRLRKSDAKSATSNLRQLLDICLLSAGLNFDVKTFLRRSQDYIEESMAQRLGAPAAASETPVQEAVVVESAPEAAEVSATENLKESVKKSKKRGERKKDTFNLEEEPKK